MKSLEVSPEKCNVIHPIFHANSGGFVEPHVPSWGPLFWSLEQLKKQALGSEGPGFCLRSSP